MESKLMGSPVPVSELWHAVPRLHGCPVLVIGDIMLDRFVYGAMERISPEAPVPILRHGSDRHMLGGAGNVAANLNSLGGVPLLVGLIGDDAEGETIRHLCREAGIDGGGLVTVTGRPTSLKTRFVVQGQQVLRYDREEVGDPDPSVEASLMAAFDRALGAARVVVLSDYGKGALAGTLAEDLIRRARRQGCAVVVDPKGADYSRYRGASLVTPNLKELAEAAATNAGDDATVVQAARGLVERHDLGAMLVTRSAAGMSLVEKRRSVHIPARAREVFDVSGAGDTVVSVVALALADGLDLESAARIANAAAGVVVGKRGTAQVSPAELILALRTEQQPGAGSIVDRATACGLAESWREQGLRIGFTNGCFDILHAGHVTLVTQAKAACDRLIVAVNSDASVRRLKGQGRPINTEAERAAVLAALSAVDLVVMFDEDTPLALIEAIQPDSLIKGADYTVDQVVGAEFVLARGGRVELIELMPGRSTTRLVDAIRNRPGDD
jgi:D-beta-D-heptose 7-phosphate kinase/D-beta-D-heptose 1-phosphate adenosyltransferase